MDLYKELTEKVDKNIKDNKYQCYSLDDIYTTAHNIYMNIVDIICKENDIKYCDEEGESVFDEFREEIMEYIINKMGYSDYYWKVETNYREK